MKKIFIILLLPVLTACTLPFAITKNTTYKAKLEKYRSEAPSGYSFSVEQTYPYKLVRFPHKIIQVVGPNEVLACQVYSEIVYKWQYGQCADDKIRHIIFANTNKRLIDNELFDYRFYKENSPYQYTSTLGSVSTVRSFTVVK